jgi:hypothetical protein
VLSASTSAFDSLENSSLSPKSKTRAETVRPEAASLRLLTTTTLGLGLGIYEAFRLAPGIAMLLLLTLALFGGGIAWIITIASAESRAGPPGEDSRATTPGER